MLDELHQGRHGGLDPARDGLRIRGADLAGDDGQVSAATVAATAVTRRNVAAIEPRWRGSHSPPNSEVVAVPRPDAGVVPQEICMSALSVAYERCPFLAEAAAPRELRFDLRAAAPHWPTANEESRRAAMVQVYDRSGGLARSEEVLFRLRRRTSQPLSMLARWIVDQRVVSFEWQAQRFLPMFQFDLADMAIQPETISVLAELAGIFDDWELAAWFAEPSVWLQGRSPVDVLAFDTPAVVAAARADRFVARG
jgi:hypothetical protein